MLKDTIYKRSLKALQEFIAETPADELAEIITECEKMVTTGPTFDEYLNKLQKELGNIDWHPCYGKAIPLNKKELRKYMIEYYDDYYSPPRARRNTVTNKKDSAIFAESFFLL
jgi:hypothetical protein